METQMLAETSAQATPGSIFYARQYRNQPTRPYVSRTQLIDTTILKCWKSALLSLCIFVALISAPGPILVAQTGNVVISTNTTYATGTYNLTSLSVIDGATLTIGGVLP